MQEKVHAAAIAVLESKAYFMEENAKANEQLETAKMEIEELKGRIKMMPGDVGSTRNARLLKDEGDISHTRMKDIQLDHVSNRSSPRLTSDVYAGPIHQSEEIESFNFEKDLAVDKIEMSGLSGGTQEGSRKILEKLVSDAERLANIQASVLDMENRIEQADKDKLTSFEYNSLMAQLREIEGVISQLLEMRGKLVKAAEEETLGSGRRIRRVDERGLSRGRQVSEQARRWSEKIARMELEVQQIRFLLFKLEEEYDRKGKKTLERRRVQLRDYLYGGTYDTYRKKRYLCACMEPSTKED